MRKIWAVFGGWVFLIGLCGLLVTSSSPVTRFRCQRSAGLDGVCAVITHTLTGEYARSFPMRDVYWFIEVPERPLDRKESYLMLQLVNAPSIRLTGVYPQANLNHQLQEQFTAFLGDPSRPSFEAVMAWPAVRQTWFLAAAVVGAGCAMGFTAWDRRKRKNA